MNIATKTLLAAAALAASILVAPGSASAKNPDSFSSFGSSSTINVDHRYINHLHKRHDVRSRRGFDSRFRKGHGHRFVSRFNKRSHRGFGYRGNRSHLKSQFGVHFGPDYSKRNRGFVFFKFK